MTRPTPVFLPAALGLLLAGCAATSTTAAREPASTGGEAAALAATFRHLFADNASALKSNAATYCIGTGTSGAEEPARQVESDIRQATLKVTGR